MKEKILIICAHPDDAELECGGFIMKYRTRFDISVLILTNGSRGSRDNLSHDTILSEIREKEARQAAVYGNYSVFFGCFNDGELMDSLDIRNKIISFIRLIKPVAVFTHRDNDYHPDHRCVSRMVQDSLVAIYCDGYLPEYPAIDYVPAVLFFWNRFDRPSKFSCDLYIDITDYIEEKKQLLEIHTSQFSNKELIESELYKKGRIINQLYSKMNEGYGEAFELCQYLREQDVARYINMFNGIS